MTARVVVFGVDGLTFKVLHPLMERGGLTNFRRLQQQGCEALLESKYPPVTPPAWVSLYTGLKPANHGIYDFWDFGEQKGSGLACVPTLVTHRKGGKAIWNILSEFGKKVLIINIPMTYPPEPVNGIMVSGYMTPHIYTQYTYPATFKDELMRIVPGYEIDLPLEDKVAGKMDKKWRVLHATLHMTKQRFKLIEYLLKEKSWDFCFLGFVGADRIQHRLWDEIMALDARAIEYYAMLDDGLGRIIDMLGPDDSLFVVSDHGFQGASRSFEINEYLYSKGFITLTNHSQYMRARAHRKNMLRQTLKSAGLFKLAKQTSRLVDTRRTSEASSNLDIDDPHIFRASNIAWGKTLAFVPSSSGFGSGYADVFLSPKIEKEQIEEIRAGLLQVVDPTTKKPLLKSANTAEVFGKGRYAPREPHLLLLPGDDITFRRGLGNVHFWDDAMMADDPARRSGVHHPSGVLYAYGSAFKQGFRAPTAEIYDLVPTILHHMGLPSPTPCDGHVLKQLFREYRHEKHLDCSLYEISEGKNKHIPHQKLAKLLEE